MFFLLLFFVARRNKSNKESAQTLEPVGGGLHSVDACVSLKTVSQVGGKKG